MFDIVGNITNGGKDLTRKHSIYSLLWLLTIFWILFIFTLSYQDGTQTAQTGGGIAQDVVEIIYQQSTETKINKVYFNIRKLAHIGRFFILGVLSFSASATTILWEKKGKYLAVVTASVITIGYGFFDEWHKQFISGRHFQLNEVVLNMVFGIMGIILSVFIYIIIHNTKNTTE